MLKTVFNRPVERYILMPSESVQLPVCKMYSQI